jgi:hypothetical protein
MIMAYDIQGMNKSGLERGINSVGESNGQTQSTANETKLEKIIKTPTSEEAISKNPTRIEQIAGQKTTAEHLADNGNSNTVGDKKETANSCQINQTPDKSESMCKRDSNHQYTRNGLICKDGNPGVLSTGGIVDCESNVQKNSTIDYYDNLWSCFNKNEDARGAVQMYARSEKGQKLNVLAAHGMPGQMDCVPPRKVIEEMNKNGRPIVNLSCYAGAIDGGRSNAQRLMDDVGGKRSNMIACESSVDMSGSIPVCPTDWKYGNGVSLSSEQRQEAGVMNLNEYKKAYGLD